MLEALTQRLQGVFGKRPSKTTIGDGVMSDSAYPAWDWIQANRTTLQQRYAGRWIAVVGAEIVAVADTAGQLMDQTEQYDRPFMYRVPGEAEPAVVA